MPLGAGRPRRARSTSRPSRWRWSTASPATGACAAPSPAAAMRPAPLADPTVAFDLRGEGIDAAVLTTNGVPPLDADRRRPVPRHGAAPRLAPRVTGAGGLELHRLGHASPSPAPASTPPSPAPRRSRSPTRCWPSAPPQATPARCASTPPPAARSTAPQLGGTGLAGRRRPRRPADQPPAAGHGARRRRSSGNAVVLESFRADVVDRRQHHRPGPRRRSAPRLPGRPDRAHQQRALHRRRLRQHPASRRSRAATARWSAAAACSRARSTSAAPRSPSPRASAPTSSQALDQVDHIDPPPAGAADARPRPGRPSPAAVGPSRPPASASTSGSARPNQIFVRGRGLDVELGGELRVQGTTTDIQPVGQFDLRRGRLIVLGQRIEFDEGSLQLVGNLDPQIHFVARNHVRRRHRHRHRRRPGLGAADHLLLRAGSCRRTRCWRACCSTAPPEPVGLPAGAARRRGGRARRRRRRPGLPRRDPRRHRPRRPRHHHPGGRLDRGPRRQVRRQATSTSTCRPTPRASAAPRSTSTSATT